MPPRLLILAIVLFWLGSFAWLFYRDLWPRLRSGEPPPFTIDLADEARQHNIRVKWTILRGDTRIGTAETWVDYCKEDDTFEFHNKVEHLNVGGLGLIRLKVENMTDMYRVARDGSLREILIDTSVGVDALRFHAQLHIEGKVDGAWFKPRAYVEFGRDHYDLELEPVQVSGRGNVTNPLHAVNRITGLRPGRHWQTPMFDPLSVSLRAMAQKDPALQFLLEKIPEGTMLQAEVLRETPQLRYDNRFYGCLVIEYRSNNMIARTYVRESDGLVLRQAASIWGDQVTLERN